MSDINEHISFHKKLTGKTTGDDIFQVIDSKENNLKCKSCSHICTDGAAAMTGRARGLLGRVNKLYLDIKWMDCIIHREALAS